MGELGHVRPCNCHSYGDGSVHFVSDSISADVYVAATTRASNETDDDAF